MGLMARIMNSLSKKISNETPSDKAKFIFYKIVKYSEETNKFLLQCINTSAFFFAGIHEIILDETILSGLHPVQSCYIGIEYARYFYQSGEIQKDSHYPLYKLHSSRYGKYTLYYQSRNKKLCFIDLLNMKEITMEPCEIAFNEILIQEFDALQSFYIGLLAGIQMNETARPKNRNSIHKFTYLHVIK